MRKTINLTQDQVIQGFRDKHGNRYDYSLVEYIGQQTEVKIICPIHGVFMQKPYNHQMGNGCVKCGLIQGGKLRQYNQDKVIVSFKQAHGNKYDYSKVIYTGDRNKVVITCPIHGDFLQEPRHHKNGVGCHECALIVQAAATKKYFIEHAQEKLCTCYIIRCYNDQEEFYKIGVTSRRIQTRFSAKREMPYDYEIIKQYQGSARFAADKEEELHKIHKVKGLQYKPKIIFCGSNTECFIKLWTVENIDGSLEEYMKLKEQL